MSSLIIALFVLIGHPSKVTSFSPSNTVAHRSTNHDSVGMNDSLVSNSNLSNSPVRAHGRPVVMVVGGDDVKPSKYPFFAVIEGNNGGAPICGGTLIKIFSKSEHYFGSGVVLTAAHCLNGRSSLFSQWRVRINPWQRHQRHSGVLTHETSLQASERHNLRYTTDVIRPIFNAKLHPGYQPSNFVRDIAVIQLGGPLFGTPLYTNSVIEKVATITLRSDKTLVPPQTMLSVIGFGMLFDRTRRNQSRTTSRIRRLVRAENQNSQPLYPEVLQEAHIPSTSSGQCADAFPWLKSYTESVVMCAGWDDGRSDACYGDSGGPLVRPLPSMARTGGIVGDDSDSDKRIKEGDELMWEQIGIVSFGSSCAIPGSYGVYTMLGNVVASHRDDLVENTKGLSNWALNVNFTVISPQPPNWTVSPTRTPSDDQGDNFNTNGNKSHSLPLIAIAVTCSAAFLIMVSAVIVVCCCIANSQKKKQREREKQAMEEQSSPSTSQSSASLCFPVAISVEPQEPYS